MMNNTFNNSLSAWNYNKNYSQCLHLYKAKKTVYKIIYGYLKNIKHKKSHHKILFNRNRVNTVYLNLYNTEMYNPHKQKNIIKMSYLIMTV
jgi:hypothetical protein